MSRCSISLTALCALLVASTALAQGGAPGGFGGRGGLGALRNMRMPAAMLLYSPDVQKELSITDDQLNKLQTAATEMTTDMQSSIQNIFMGNMSQDEMTKAINDMTKKADARVAKILTEDQLARLKQLQLQSDGVNALVRADIVDKLKITDDQKAKIQKIVSDAQQPQRGGFGAMFDPNQTAEERQAAIKKMQDQMQEQRAKTLKDALAVLEDDQLVQWGEMTGKEFKFSNNGFGGLGGMMGGFGGRGNRGGGGGGN